MKGGNYGEKNDRIKGGDETRDFRFEPYDRLQAAGNVVDRANYEQPEQATAG